MYKLRKNTIVRVDAVNGDEKTTVEFFIDSNSPHYQQFIKDVQEQGTGIVEGETIIEPDYVALRTGEDGYAPVTEQLEMQVDGTWDAHIADVKSRFPKTITGSTSIADLPQWVKEIT